jgi:hypothetical protein
MDVVDEYGAMMKYWLALENEAGKEIGLEVNTEKTKYMLLSRQQNTGQNRDIKVGNRCFGNVEQFKYLGTT